MLELCGAQLFIESFLVEMHDPESDATVCQQRCARVDYGRRMGTRQQQSRATGQRCTVHFCNAPSVWRRDVACKLSGQMSRPAKRLNEYPLPCFWERFLRNAFQRSARQPRPIRQRDKGCQFRSEVMFGPFAHRLPLATLGCGKPGLACTDDAGRQKKKSTLQRHGRQARLQWRCRNLALALVAGDLCADKCGRLLIGQTWIRDEDTSR